MRGMAVKPAQEKKSLSLGMISVVILLGAVALAAVAMPFVGNSNRRAQSTIPDGGGPTIGGLLSDRPSGSPAAKSTNVLVMPPATNVPPGAVSKLLADGDRAFAAGKLSDARYYYWKATQLDPVCETCVAKMKQMEGALIKEIGEAMRSAESYVNTGRFDEAIRAYERVQFLDSDPNGSNFVNAARLIAETKKKKEEMAQR